MNFPGILPRRKRHGVMNSQGLAPRTWAGTVREWIAGARRRECPTNPTPLEGGLTDRGSAKRPFQGRHALGMYTFQLPSTGPPLERSPS